MGVAFCTSILIHKDHMTFGANSRDSSYKSSKGVTRHFCGVCGCSTYFEEAALGDWLIVSGGTLDGDLGVSVTGEIFVNYKIPFHQLTPGVPNCGELELAANLDL